MISPGAGHRLGQNQPAKNLWSDGGLLVTYLLLFAALMLIIGWENASSAVRHRRLLRRSHEKYLPDYRLDMVGEPCPYPAVATLRRCRN